jgi:hypothetical protein
MSVIYETDSSEFILTHDEDDTQLPIGFEVNGESHWLEGPEAIIAAKGILSALGDEAHSESDYKTEVFRFAKAFGRTVEFRYAKGDGANIETRRLVPHEVQEVKGNLLVIGDDPDRDGDVRAYRLDRVKGDPVIA